MSFRRTWLPGGSVTTPNPPSNLSEDKIGPLGLNTLSVPSGGSANVDLISAHGLDGGSRKTWTKSGDPSLYWPKEWLPTDEALQDVRIHTFGYDSNWGKKSILGIHTSPMPFLILFSIVHLSLETEGMFCYIPQHLLFLY